MCRVTTNLRTRLNLLEKNFFAKSLRHPLVCPTFRFASSGFVFSNFWIFFSVCLTGMVRGSRGEVGKVTLLSLFFYYFFFRGDGELTAGGWRLLCRRRLLTVTHTHTSRRAFFTHALVKRTTSHLVESGYRERATESTVTSGRQARCTNHLG